MKIINQYLQESKLSSKVIRLLDKEYEVDPFPSSTIKIIERELKFKLTDDYKQLILRYGFLSDGNTISGITDKKLRYKQFENVLFLNKSMLKKSIKGMICISYENKFKKLLFIDSDSIIYSTNYQMSDKPKKMFNSLSELILKMKK